MIPQSPVLELLESAWNIIANVSGGDWEKESPEWQFAAHIFRDQYFGFLEARNNILIAADQLVAQHKQEYPK